MTKTPIPPSIPRLAVLCCAVFLSAGFLRAQEEVELSDLEELHRAGKYEEVLERAELAMTQGNGGVDFRMLVVDALMALGRDLDAAKEIGDILTFNRNSPRALLKAYEVLRQNGELAQAEELLAYLNRISGDRSLRYRPPQDIVALGKAALLYGAEPKQVLREYFDFAVREHPGSRAPYLAAGDLALLKQDDELAADYFQKGLELHENDPDLMHGLAASFFASDRQRANELLLQVLSVNPRHLPSLLLLAEHMIATEAYDRADELLEKALATNPSSPRAWAFRTVLGNLRGQPEKEAEAYAEALKYWPTNPEVDYDIGRILAKKYRFEEAARHQRRALENDPGFTPALIELAQNLLRLGKLDEGWDMVDRAQRRDPYNVTLYNLATLRDTLGKFKDVRSEHFLVRMGKKEADIFGGRVLELLEEAREVLATKYGFDMPETVVIEMFPSQADFAIRTFGLPTGADFLGVCFGNVITMNSPGNDAMRGNNWESTLWHEFAHTITLGVTNNKMPRWLSEGISVYEERQRDDSWGQRMTPRYRDWILNEDKLTPIGEFSSAFLNAPDGEHLMFAYYQAMLVVEFFVEEYGIESLRGILRDLGTGKLINPAIEEHTEDMETVEEKFVAFAEAKAEALAPEMDWEEPEAEFEDLSAVEAYLEDHPNNYIALNVQARLLIQAREFEKAKEPLETLIKLYPGDFGQENPYQLLAMVHNELGETAKEKEVLKILAKGNAEDLRTYERLMDLAAEEEDWHRVQELAERYRAVDPMDSELTQYEAEAADARGDKAKAVEAYSRYLLLDPEDPAHAHYRLASIVRGDNLPKAKRHTLMALAEAPRFRDAHRLLLDINQQLTENPPQEAPQPETGEGPEPESGTEAEVEDEAPAPAVDDPFAPDPSNPFAPQKAELPELPEPELPF